MTLRTWICSLALCLAVTPAVAQVVTTPVETTFDQNLEGWAVTAGQNAVVVHASPDGNPGGYARMSLGGVGRTDIEAPASYLGDWTALDGSGLLEFDHWIVAIGGLPIGPPYMPYEVYIEGPGGQARFLSAATAQTSWTTASVPIQDQAWNVEAGTWSGLLADVQILRIRIELVGNNGSPDDTNGIDNVRLTNPTPVPSISWVGGAILVALLAATARTRRRSAAR